MQFIIFFICMFSVISGSRPDLFSKYCDNINKKNPTKYEDLADYCLSHTYYNAVSGRGNSSIFSKNLTYVLSQSTSSASVNEEYASLMNGLDRYLKRFAVSITVKARSETLTQNERETFINAMHLVAIEDVHFASHCLNDFVYSPKTLELIFTALKAIDPLAVDTLELIAKFVKFCKTDLQLKGPLATIVKALEGTSRNIPLLYFNSDLTETTEFDHLIRELYSKNCNSIENIVLLAKNIIYGPITEASTHFLYSIIDLQSILEPLCSNDTDLYQMIRHVFTTFSHSRFERFIATNPTDSPIITKIQLRLNNQHNNVKAIYAFMDYGHLVDATTKEKLELFETRSQALDEYYTICKRFVERSLLIIDSRITALIRYTHGLASEREFNSGIFLLFKYFNVFPSIRLEQELTSTFEQFLDLMMHPLTDVIPLLVSYTSFIMKTSTLPYIKIDRHILQKIYRVYISIVPEIDSIQWIEAVSVMLISNKNSDEKLMCFKEIHTFYELENLCMESVAKASILMAYSEADKSLTKNLLGHSIENRLISKSFILAVQQILDLWLKLT